MESHGWVSRTGFSRIVAFSAAVLVLAVAALAAGALAFATISPSTLSARYGQLPVQRKQAPPKNAPAKTPTDTLENSAMQGTHELTAEDVAIFLDGFIPGQIERQDIAGAVVIIVKDGKVLYGHGYGYSDVEKKKPVSVNDTLFRPGSVSKLFTCTAVMQLVEQGKLDLDRDVNEYLDFKIPATFPAPVTLRRIMTHTTGFEEWDKELFVATAAEMQSTSAAMREHLPARVFPPDTMPAYSNYAMSLAGYIVERISGERFEDYVANHILKPLQMSHATFVQPLPADLAPLMSTGYDLGSGKPKSFEFVNGIPAGAMSVSAGDISRFMIAHLQDGRYENVQILRPETARLMHSRAFGLVPELNGMDLAFFQENENGHSIIGHGGDTQYFHSHLHLILDAGTGLFISVNSAGRSGGDIRGQLWRKFLDRYFPGGPPLQPAISTAAQDAKTVSGNYISSRRGETTITKFIALSGETTFSPDPENTISSPDLKGINGQPRHWREIAPMLFRDVDGQARIAFRKNSAGDLVMFPDMGAFAEQRASGLNNGNLVLAALIFVSAIFALTLLLWPVSAIARRHYQRPLTLSPGERRLRFWTKVVCLLDAALMLAWVQYFNYVFADIGRASRHSDWMLDVIHVAQIFAIVGTMIAIIYAIGAWSSRDRWRWNKLFDPIVAIACLVFVWVIYICNFIHFGTKY